MAALPHLTVVGVGQLYGGGEGGFAQRSTNGFLRDAVVLILRGGEARETEWVTVVFVVRSKERRFDFIGKGGFGGAKRLRLRACALGHV